MTNLIIAKFGGSAIGPDGISISQIIERINNLKKDSKVIAVFSAPLTLHNENKRSLTDVVLEQGKNAENGIRPSLDIVKIAYQKILQMVNDDNKKRSLRLYDSIYLNDEVITDEKSHIIIEYLDNSTIILKRSSSIKIKKFKIKL